MDRKGRSGGDRPLWLPKLRTLPARETPNKQDARQLRGSLPNLCLATTCGIQEVNALREESTPSGSFQVFHATLLPFWQQAVFQ